MCFSVQLILFLEPCYILKNLQESTSEGYMPSQNLRQNLSRISNFLKNTHKPLKKIHVITSNIVQSGQVQKKANNNNKC